MRSFLYAGAASIVTLAACVTINVYFPAAAAEQAADKIISDVLGTEPAAGKKPGNDTAALEGSFQRFVVAAGNGVLNLVVPVAHAQADIDISSPGVRRIRESMKARNASLEPFYQSGAVGFTMDAMVAVRDLNSVPLRDRNTVRQLVADENRDRDALYREIATVNGHPEWEEDIRATFAKRWIANARSGWYYQNDGGDWRQK